MKCNACPSESSRPISSPLCHLCNDCIILALAEAKKQQEVVKSFVEKYRHSPAFVLEFGHWALSGGQVF